MEKNFYPQSPDTIPSNLLELPSTYKSRVIAVLVSIILFVALYLVLVALAAYSVYLAAMMPMMSNFWGILFKFGMIGITIMFFFFTLKFLFKKSNPQSATNVELKEKDHPQLFQFIRNLCDETGAPFPKKIIVNEQINAAVFYNDTILSMFLPVKKNLLIGLGLVNSLNLTEFKAVLAHEFGHFSQRSMKLGSYVYMANRIIHDMVYSRDKWDETLDNWGRSDFRIAIFAWILKAVVWIIRKIMELIYKGINLLHASLSRQMEFNADLVAVSVTGSAQIINALSKLGRSSQAMNMAMSQLSDAADHQLFTRNIFYHQALAEDHLKTNVKGFEDRQPIREVDGNPYLFRADELDVPDMYASHPSNYDRENNAKKVFVDGTNDTRSSWILFDNPEALKELVTQKLYSITSWNPSPNQLKPADEVNNFIQAEMQETSFDPKYHGAYDDRYIHIGEVSDAKKTAKKRYPDLASIEKAYAKLYNKKLKKAMEQRINYYKEQEYLSRAFHAKKSFEFRGTTHKKKEALDLYNKVGDELAEQYQNWFKDFDERVIHVHMAMLFFQKMPVRKEYFKRCHFHRSVQKYNQTLQEIHAKFQEIMGELMQKDELSEYEVDAAERDITELCQGPLATIVQESSNLPMPRFENMDDYGDLGAFLYQGQIIRGGSNLLNETWINKFSEQLSTVQSRCKRVYFKSLGKLISLQEDIREEFVKNTESQEE